MITIPFIKRYHKLLGRQFSTVRGKSWLKKMHAGDRHRCKTPDGEFDVWVRKVEPARLGDLTLEFLKHDAEYPGFIINEKQDFINLLNSFRAPAWQQATLDSEVTVVYLERCE